MNAGLVFVVLVSISSATSYKSYAGYQLWSYKINSESQQAIVEEIESTFPSNLVDIWRHGTKRQNGLMLFAPQIRRNLTTILQQNGITIRHTHQNIQRMINSQFRHNRLHRIRSMFYRSQRQEHTYFMRYEELIRWVRGKAMACRLPLKCSTEVIGRTRYGRELLVLKISTGYRPAKIWIDAGIHAREWIAPSTGLFLIDKFLSYGPQARRILNKFDIHLLPLMNPDGYEYTHTHTRFWRKNLKSSYSSSCFGVDLNRNWEYKWGGRGASHRPCMENYRGVSAFSEHETSSVNRYLNTIKSDLKLFITLHSFGQFILMPFSHKKNTYPKNIRKLRDMGHRVAQRLDSYSGRFYDVGSAADLLYEAAGGSDDYAAAVLKIPYPFTIELPDEGRYGFLLPPQYIRQVGEEMWVAVREFTSQITV